MPAQPIALVSAGEMGARLGAVLVRHGLTVLTCVEGRGDATRARAAQAGLQTVPLAQLRQAGVLLSVVPSDQALPAATTLQQAGVLGPDGPLYVDCNPLNEASVRSLAALLAQARSDWVDACILGGAPGAAGATVRLCVAGPRAAEVSALGAYGIEVEVLPGPLGSASALRIGVSGLSKSLVVLLTAVIGHAEANGVGEPLRRELARSHGALLAWTARQAARLPAAAPRWSEELREVAGDLDEGSGAAVFTAMARYLEGLARSG